MGLKARIRYCKRFCRLIYLYEKYKKKDDGISEASYKFEYKKYRTCLRSKHQLGTLEPQIEEFFPRTIHCLSRKAGPFSNPDRPTVVCVVKDELDRMQLFFDHYRKLGVKQFAILDNGSSDGTLAYLLEQKDTHVYSVKEPFQTQKKEAWIEKVLTMEDYDRWYIVVDSDELLDYPGSEKYGIDAFIKELGKGGHKRAWGMMLDMYSDQPLFSVECEPFRVPEVFSYFDRDSYTRYRMEAGKKVKNMNAMVGGPRFRVFGSEPILSKQSIFYFDRKTLYRNCHYLYPLIGWEDAPFCFILRHYKFLKADQAVYKKRIEEKSFHNNSSEYAHVMDAFKEGAETMYYEGSVHYEDSYSLQKLPFLTSFWDK